MRAWARRVRVRGGSAPRAADAADDEEEDDEERSEHGSQLIDQNSQVLWTGSALRTGPGRGPRDDAAAGDPGKLDRNSR